MSVAVIAACLWALAATATAMLPMSRQYAPGLILVLLAPILILWLGAAHGWVWATVALLSVISMFRRPLACFTRRLLGGSPEVP